MLALRTLTVLMLLAVSPAVRAQDYPARPITVIVGFAAGGFADSLARLVGGKLTERLGQNVVIENRGGASGNIAAAVVAKAPPDGYTVLVTTTGLSFYEVLTRNRTFSVDELRAVAIPAWSPETLSVPPNSPLRTLADLVRVGKGKPISFASPGAGTASHLSASFFFKELAKIEVVHVPFQGGAPAVNAAIGGHVDALVGSLPGYAGQLRSGAIRGLAIASDRRIPEFADIPTYGESGYVGFKAATWAGFFVPARTSDAVVTRLNTAINDALPELAGPLSAQHMQIERRNAAETTAYFSSEIESWRRMIGTIGFTLE